MSESACSTRPRPRSAGLRIGAPRAPRSFAAGHPGGRAWSQRVAGAKPGVDRRAPDAMAYVPDPASLPTRHRPLASAFEDEASDLLAMGEEAHVAGAFDRLEL